MEHSSRRVGVEARRHWSVYDNCSTALLTMSIMGRMRSGLRQSSGRRIVQSYEGITDEATRHPHDVQNVGVRGRSQPIGHRRNPAR